MQWTPAAGRRNGLGAIMVVLLSTVCLLGQGSAVVGGRILRLTDGVAVVSASVVVEDAASGQQLSGTLTGENGRFLLQGLAPGRYTIRISFPGLQPAEADVLVSPLNPVYDLGDIRLPRIEGRQDEITVMAEADAVRTAAVDSQVFRLDDGPAQSTGTLLDAMKTLPGVTVDQEGKVSLRGSDRVAVLIDGKPSSLTGFGTQRGLDSVSAANIAAIEIINNPSARFDAAGMAGIINIIYKKEEQRGLSGDAGLSFGMGQFTKQQPDLPTDIGSFTLNEKTTPSLNLNHRSENLRTFLQADVLFQDDLPNNEFATRFYDDGRVIESQVPENREQYHYTIRGGSDWTVNASNTASLSGIYDYEKHIDVAQVPFILRSTRQRERFWFWREEESTGFANVNFNWSHRFALPGHELDINLQYTRGKEDEAYYLNEESRIRVGRDMTHLIAIENTLPLSIDYVRPMRSGRIEVGGKLQRRWIPVTYTVERGQQSVIYQGLGDFSNWDEDIVAAYGNLIHVRPTYTLEAGLRLEQTRVRYEIPRENIYYPGNDSYRYFEAFPNIKLSRNLGRSSRIIAAYNRRVDRPGEPELRIFPKYDDPELLKVGNPFLRPQFTNAVELGLSRSWKGGSSTATLYRRDIRDSFRRIFAIDPSNPAYNIVNRIFENAGNSDQTGIEWLLDQDILPRWRLSGSVNTYRNSIDAFSTTLLFPVRRPLSLAASANTTWDFKVSNRFQLPRSLELQTSYIYYARRNIPQGRERARSSLDVSAKLPVRERIELLFTFTDIFNDFGIQHEVDGQGFRVLYQNLMETQVATIGMRIRF